MGRVWGDYGEAMGRQWEGYRETMALAMQI